MRVMFILRVLLRARESFLNIKTMDNKERGQMKKLSKQGAEMTISTIIVIVLALIVLVVIVLGFSTGWASLWDKLTNFFVKPNAGSVVQACQVACASNSYNDYCTYQRSVKFGNDDARDKSTLKFTCKQLETVNPSVGLDVCGAITCPALVKCADASLGGEWVEKGKLENVKCPASKEDLTAQVTDMSELSNKLGGKLCCKK